MKELEEILEEMEKSPQQEEVVNTDFLQVGWILANIDGEFYPKYFKIKDHLALALALLDARCKGIDCESFSVYMKRDELLNA